MDETLETSVLGYFPRGIFWELLFGNLFGNFYLGYLALVARVPALFESMLPHRTVPVLFESLLPHRRVPVLFESLLPDRRVLLLFEYLLGHRRVAVPVAPVLNCSIVKGHI